MDFEFIRLLQNRLANISVSPSAARRMGPAGTIESVRRYLYRVDLSQFSTGSEKDFQISLNYCTNALRKRLPEGGKHWGSSRKLLNMFLRSAVYDRHLSGEYGLKHIEPWLELPIDSLVAIGLRRESGGERLPTWRNVIGLTHHQNRKYQAFASEVAGRYGTSRVHLDLLYWRNIA